MKSLLSILSIFILSGCMGKILEVENPNSSSSEVIETQVSKAFSSKSTLSATLPTSNSLALSLSKSSSNTSPLSSQIILNLSSLNSSEAISSSILSSSSLLATSSALSSSSIAFSSSQLISSSIALSSSSQIACEDIDEPNSLTDCRDNQVYKTVTIGNQTWMAENLNYGGYTYSERNVYQENNQKHCYDNDTSNCDIYGALYQWHTVMQFPKECSDGSISCQDRIVDEYHQGICPNGWHVPEALEWDTLAIYIGGTIINTNHYQIAGNKLKSTIYGGINSTGFNAILSGRHNYNSSFINKDVEVLFAQINESKVSYENLNIRGLNNFDDILYHLPRHKRSSISLRCLRN
jgi:uncharacterized protein (TIGR02145 family)